MKKAAMLITVLLAVFSTVVAFAEAKVDYDSGMITVSAYSAYENLDSEGQQTALHEYVARGVSHDAALADARKQLDDFVSAISVMPTQTVGDLMASDPAVAAKVTRLVKNADVILDEAGEKGYNISLQLPLYGINDSVSRAVLPQIYVQDKLPAVPDGVAEAGGYTGLVIDCSGLGIRHIMTPAIIDTAGRQVYFYKAMLWDKVVRFGMAAYGNDAKTLARAGQSPLVVHAMSLADNGTSPVVSVDDANRILAANEQGKFLMQCAVVIEP